MKVKALKSQISRNFTEMGQFHGKCHGCELGWSLLGMTDSDFLPDTGFG